MCYDIFPELDVRVLGKAELIYSGRAPTKPMVCIADLSPISLDGLTMWHVTMYVSPCGDVLIILPYVPLDEELFSFVDGMSSQNADFLDEVAEDYSYNLKGQAFLVMDIMARNGHLSFSKSGSLRSGIDRCLKNGSFSVYAAPDWRAQT